MIHEANGNAHVMEPASSASLPWSLGRRIGFRLTFVYLVLYLFPFPLGGLPGMSLLPQWLQAALMWLPGKYQTLVTWAVLWVGKHILRIESEIPVVPTGSGDTMFAYIHTLCLLAAAMLATIVWTLLDRRRRGHPRLHEYFRVYVRYALALIVLGYGFAKVIKTQFPYPDVDRLIQPIGQASPMGLLWTFMGYSTAYTVFAGAAECLGALLLMWRRTTMLGALVVAGVMLNVVVMNFSYDVPVKLYSTQLFLMAVYLLLPDLRRLLNFFMFNRVAVPSALGRLFVRGRLRWTALIVKILFIGGTLVESTMQSLEGWRTYGSGAAFPELHGLYDVEKFFRDGDEVPPVLTELTRWRRVAVNRYGQFKLQTVDDAMHRFVTKDPKDGRTLELAPWADRTRKILVTYTRPEANIVDLEGEFPEGQIRARLRRVELATFPLTSRGFHWINEFPYNR